MTDNLKNTRLRFAPSPTGYLHVGGARTMLFNWLVARRTRGTLILRIEDTDRTRHVADSVDKIIDDLRWLGMDWDEGPVVGGDAGPYFQSKRLDIYNEQIRRLLETGKAYYALETTQQLDAMRRESRKKTGGFSYPRPDPLPTIEEGEQARAQGQPAVVRLLMPREDLTVRDEILGEVTIPAGQHEDFVIQKSDGYPTYHLACVVDDAQMGITDVLRGQEHLMNTPKHVALQQALEVDTPRYAHLPVIFNMNGSKMSKRDKEAALKRGETPPEIDVHDFRAAGYLPEALVNFIALLGWNPGTEEELFSLEELTERFAVDRVGKTNARFDRQKLLAFNTQWATRVTADRLLIAFKDFLHARDEPLTWQPADRPPSDGDLSAMLEASTGLRTFPDVLQKCSFLLTATSDIRYDQKAVKKVLLKKDMAGLEMLRKMAQRLEQLEPWTTETLDQAVKEECEANQVGMGAVAQPIRVAISGSTVTPSIGLSLSLLGRDLTLARLHRCIAACETPAA